MLASLTAVALAEGGIATIVGAPASASAREDRISSGDACGDVVGWYYDDDSRPTSILFCASTCSTVANSRQARVDVQFPCL
jgi:hypothetical protein